MEILERIWEFIGLFFGGLLRGFERTMTTLFGSSNARHVKRMDAQVQAIGALESKYEAMSDEQLREQTDIFRQRLKAGETVDDILIEAFAVCREGGKRYLGMRHYDVQMIGGMVLHSGSISEMVTGEGKTLVATLPAYLNAIEGKGVHVITVNDYLARRDMEWMAPLYMGLGLTVGAIQSDMPVSERQDVYSRDITYGTNNEFGFDYLRDNMRPAARRDNAYPSRMQQSQGPLHYAIIDEVDNILIDEARTPLIISGPAFDNLRKYADADRVARQLKKDKHFEVNEKDHNVGLTDEGVREAERLAGVESFYTAGNMEWPHLIDNSLKAHYLYKRDVNYVVRDGRVIIVDEFTGRLMEGRQWSDGLHQAVEAKEGVKIKEETQTLATITLQNFFKLYDKICGMTGTAMTEATEFVKIYELDVVAIPTNREMQRANHPDMIFCTEEEKYTAIANEIEKLNRWDTLTFKDGTEKWGTILKEEDDSILFQPKGTKEKETIQLAGVTVQKKGRPILVGTTSIEKSELVSSLLDKRGVSHQVLNAKHHKREAEIVAQAGRVGGVTIATNMAGRGTDIVLGGNPETMAWAVLQDKYETRLDVPHDEWETLVAEIDVREKMSEMGGCVKELGGLHVIGTERHESRRIDLQLRGRCGRQGDPGSSRFYLSLKDDLMRIFAGPWVEKILKSLGLPEGEAIESKMVSRRIEAAQKKVEERNFEIRKNLLEYDEVMDEQRKRVYSYRQKILDGTICKDLILEMVEMQVEQNVNQLLDPDFGTETFASWAGNRLATSFEASDFRRMDFESASSFAKDEAERRAETQVFDAVDENLPESEEDDWNWGALTKFANTRWGLSLRDRDLKKIGRNDISELLIEKSRDAIRQIDLSEGEVFLRPDFGPRSAAGWVHNKFGIEIEPAELQDQEDIDACIANIAAKAIESYEQRESEYPVMAGMYRYSTKSGGQSRIDRESLVAWAKQRFDANVEFDDLKSKQREEIREFLVDFSQQHLEKGRAAVKEVKQRVEELFGDSTADTVEIVTGGNGQISSLTQWLEDSFKVKVTEEEIKELDRESLELRLVQKIDARYRPEMRNMERRLLLEIVDVSWKDHLLSMDHLRSSVSLVGYAQVDPKVEYKRKGMERFEQMWDSVGQRVTDLVFRMEQLDEGFVGSTWVETAATHAEAESVSELAEHQQTSIDNSGSDKKLEPIRNRGKQASRNEPCPCGSGKKYKNCCMRNRGSAA